MAEGRNCTALHRTKKDRTVERRTAGVRLEAGPPRARATQRSGCSQSLSRVYEVLPIALERAAASAGASASAITGIVEMPVLQPLATLPSATLP